MEDRFQAKVQKLWEVMDVFRGSLPPRPTRNGRMSNVVS